MFWKKKAKCPITDEDRIWVENTLNWFQTNFLALRKQPTFTPTRKYFPHKFEGVEEDAEFLLEQIGDYFQLNTRFIGLDFFDQSNLKLGPGLMTQQDKGAAGYFRSAGYSYSISIEVNQLKDLNSLIATMAHELSHYLIMIEKGYHFEETKNELLTDMAVVAYGFGIFLGNSKFKFKQWSSGDGYGGWRMSSQGYLPQEVIAYAMAEIQRRKGELEPEWVKYMDKSFAKLFTKSTRYLQTLPRGPRKLED